MGWLRTTLTIDPEVLRAVKVRAARPGTGDSGVSEEALRRDLGLDLLDRLGPRTTSMRMRRRRWPPRRSGTPGTPGTPGPDRAPPVRAVLDANALISANLSRRGAPAAPLRAWQSGAFELIVSPLVLAEPRRGLACMKLARLVPAADADAHMD